REFRRVRGARQGAPRAGDHRLGGQRLVQPPGDRAPDAAGEPAAPACAVQGERAGAHRSHRQPGRSDDGPAHRVDGAHPRRPHTGDHHRVAQALARPARRADARRARRQRLRSLDLHRPLLAGSDADAAGRDPRQRARQSDGESSGARALPQHGRGSDGHDAQRVRGLCARGLREMGEARARSAHRPRVGKVTMRTIYALVLALISVSALAQGSYPSRPIRLLIGFPPGAGMDAVARPYAARLSELLGQPVVVENRPGAGGAVSNAAIARAAPDGYTIGFGSNGDLVIVPLLTKVDYDPAASFTTISLVSREEGFVLLANPAFGPNNLRELVEL